MNIPLIGDVAKQDINTSLIAIRNAINELNNSSNKSNADIQKQINLINKQIKEFNIKFGDIDVHLNTIDSDITDLQPVDTVASGNLHSVTSNAVANMIKKYSITQTITARTLLNGEYVQIDVPITANKFYVGEIYFSGLPITESLSLMFNDYSGYFASSITSNYNQYNILNVIGKAYQNVLHIFITNYTGHTVNLGDILFLFNYLEFDIQDQTRDTISVLMDKQAKK